MNFFDRMIERFEIVGRARTLSVLRQQSDRSLLDAGFSPELVRIGVKAWPWRSEDELAVKNSLNRSNLTGIKPVGHATVSNVGQIEVVETGKAANNTMESAA